MNPITKQELFDTLEESGDLPTLPIVITAVLNLIRNPNTSASDIGKAISGDISLSTKILKIVNSAFYGFQRKISTITQSIVILGFNNIKAAVLGISIINAFDEMMKDSNHLIFNREDFWNHAVGCAAASRAIARHINFEQIEESFIVGMLLDVGKLILDQFAHQHFIQIFDTMKHKHLSYEESEKQVLGFTQYQLGSFIVHQWNLPDDLSEAVLHHRNPALSKIQDKDLQTLIAVVHFGRILAKSLSIGNDGEPDIPRLNKQAWYHLNIEIKDIEPLMENVLTEYQNSLAFLKAFDK